VEIDANGKSSWAAAELLALYEIPLYWDANRRRILIASPMWRPPSRRNQVQPSVGLAFV